MALAKLTGSVSTTPSYSVPSTASTVDRNVLAPAINRIIDQVNALAVQVAALTPPPSPPPPAPVVVIDISGALEAAIKAVPLGARFVLRGLSEEFLCQKDTA